MHWSKFSQFEQEKSSKKNVHSKQNPNALFWPEGLTMTMVFHHYMPPVVFIVSSLVACNISCNIVFLNTDMTCLFEGLHWWRGYFSSTARMPFDCLHFAILQKDAKGPICKWCQKIYEYLETKSPVGVSHAKTPNADAQSEGWKWHGQASWLSVFEKCCFVWIKKSRNCSSKPPQHILLYFLESQIGILFHEFVWCV